MFLCTLTTKQRSKSAIEQQPVEEHLASPMTAVRGRSDHKYKVLESPLNDVSTIFRIKI